MNKIKLILPLVMVAPALFGCNKGDVSGNYKVQKASEISHKFVKGDEASFNASNFTKLFEIKTSIYNMLTHYMGGSVSTPDNTVCLSNEMGVDSFTTTGEKVTVYPVNLRKIGESSADIAFQYGKTSSGYHFLSNYRTGYDNLDVYWRVSGELQEGVSDNGFEVNGKTLTAHFLGQFEEYDVIQYQIEFTVAATK